MSERVIPMADLCIFEIDNSQDHYARCAELIDLLESRIRTNSNPKRFQMIENRVRLFLDSGAIIKLKGKYDFHAPKYLELPIILKLGGETFIEKPPCETTNPMVFETFTSEDWSLLSKGNKHYHIRVRHVNKGQFRIGNYLYLAMLIKKLNYLQNANVPINSRISVYLLPNSEGDALTYLHASLFLRLVSKKIEALFMVGMLKNTIYLH